MRSTKLQRGLNKFVASLIVVAIMAGCASTTISDRQQVANGYLPRPGQIWVYPFAATPADVPPESALAGQSSAGASAPTDQQIAEARQLGAAIAGQLVQQINNMGMSAAVASAATRPQLNDVVVEGSLLSVQQGSAGLRKLGSGDVGSTGNKTPGMGVGLASLIATHNPAGLIVTTGMKVYGEESGSNTIQGRAQAIAKEVSGALKQRFEQEGWISAS